MWAIKHKETGEVQFVADPKVHGPDWEATKLDREPCEFDEFIDGKLVEKEDFKKQRQENARLSGMTEVEKQQEAMEKVIAMMEQHGIVPKAAAQNMRKQINGV